MKGKMNVDYISLIKSFLKTYRLNHLQMVHIHFYSIMKEMNVQISIIYTVNPSTKKKKILRLKWHYTQN